MEYLKIHWLEKMQKLFDKEEESIFSLLKVLEGGMSGELAVANVYRLLSLVSCYNIKTRRALEDIEQCFLSVSIKQLDLERQLSSRNIEAAKTICILNLATLRKEIEKKKADLKARERLICSKTHSKILEKELSQLMESAEGESAKLESLVR